LCKGPPDLRSGGFFYDVAVPEGETISATDYDQIQAIVDAIINDKQPFERIVLTKEEAKEMFKVNLY